MRKRNAGGPVWAGHPVQMFKPGDIVRPLIVSRGGWFYGIVRRTSSRENRVYVVWPDGSVRQHDPTELLLEDPEDHDLDGFAFGGRAGIVARRSRPLRASSGFDSVRDLAQEQRLESFEEVGVGPGKLDEMADEIAEGEVESGVVDGGFDIVQEVAEEQRQESFADSGVDVGVQDQIRQDEREADEAPGEEVVEGDFTVMQDVAREQATGGLAATAGMRGRRARHRSAVYFMERGRVYRKTRQEQDSGNLLCPRCKSYLLEQPFTRYVKLYVCGNCGWKIDTDHLA